MKVSKRLIALVLTCAMVLSVIVTAALAYDFSDNVYTENAPAATMKVDSSELSGATSAANTTAMSFLGINVTSTDAAGALNSASNPASPLNLLVFGSDLNENPDPYLWNFYYNLNLNGYPGSVYNMGDYNNANWTGAYTLLNNAKSGPTGSATASNNYIIPIDIDGVYKECNPLFFYEPEVLMGSSEDSYSYGVEVYQQDYNEDYNPLQVGGWNTSEYCLNDGTIASTFAMANGVYTMSKEIQKYVKGNESGKVSRYNNGSVVKCGVDYSSFALGMYYYLKGCENIGFLSEIRYCTGVEIGHNGTFPTYTITNSSEKDVLQGRYTQYLDGIATYVDDDDTAYTSTGDLKKAVDVIITDKSQYTDNQIFFFETVGIQVIDIDDIKLPSTVYGTTMQSADNILGLPYMFGLLYGNQLQKKGIDIGADDFTAYFVENLYHVKSDKVDTVLNVMYGDREYSHSTNYTSVIDSMIDKGSQHYHAHYSGSNMWLAAEDGLI